MHPFKKYFLLKIGMHMPRTHMTPILEDLTPKVESQPFKKFFFGGGDGLFSAATLVSRSVYT